MPVPQSGIKRVAYLESDTRKSVFLKTAVRKLDLSVSVLAQRIETLEGLGASTLSARALAPLDRLLVYGVQHLAPDGSCLFMKGEGWKKEVETAQLKWLFDMDVVQSRTEKRAAILKIWNVRRKVAHGPENH